MNTQTWILSVGSLAFDTVRTSRGSAERVLGGAVNYFSVAASLFSKVEIIAVVGEDFPLTHLELLSKRGIGTAGVEVKPGKTFAWAGEYGDELGEAKTLETQLNVLAEFSPTLAPEHRGAPYVFLANTDPAIQLSVLEQCRDHHLIALDTMNFWISGKRADLDKVLSRVDILCINEGEARMLSGTRNLVMAAETIRRMGPQVVVIKRGEYGAMVVSPTSTILVPAFPVREVVDPTGAGDSFAGGFVGALAEQGVTRDLLLREPRTWDQQLRRAALAGCTLASFTVEDFSLRQLLRVDRAEFDVRRAALSQMASLGL